MNYKQTILTELKTTSLCEHIISHPEIYHICGSEKELQKIIPIPNSKTKEIIVNIPETSKWYDLLDSYFTWVQSIEDEWQEFLGFKQPKQLVCEICNNHFIICDT